MGYITGVWGSRLMLESYRYVQNENITVYYIGNDMRFVVEVKEEILYAYKELENYFHLIDKGFSIRAIIAMNRREYNYISKMILKLRGNNESKKSQVAITSKNDLLILSPFAYEEESTYTYDEYKLKKVIYSQVVHIFHEFLSLNSEVSSTWIGQGIAMYLSGLWKEGEVKKVINEAIKKDMIPQLNEIQENESLYKIWAWTIVKYIEENYGKETINKIIRNYDVDDIFNILKCSIDDFEVQWKTWLKDENNLS